jgi:DNA-binding GntR family transcriptional regulator
LASPDPLADGAPALFIKRTSSAEQLADALRNAIVGRDLRPGSPLRESSISSSAGVSRNTVREAFRLLTREGLVSHTLHHGVVVTELSEQDVADIYAARRIVEGTAVVKRRPLTTTEIAGLREPLDELEDARREHDWRRIVDNDLRFHRNLGRLHRSARLESFHAGLLMELRLVASISDRLYEDAGGIDQHREIFELLIRGERARCRRLLDRHLIEAESLLRQIVHEEVA